VAGKEHRDQRSRKPERPADFLPHPETLEAYDYVIEGSAERILQLIEKEQRHRHNLEQKALASQIAGYYLGQILAAAVALAVLSVVVMLTMNGQVMPAVFLGVAGIAGMATAFVKGRHIAMLRFLQTTRFQNPPAKKPEPKNPTPL